MTGRERMIRIGVAGWSYDDWAGRVYPRRKPAGFHPLAYLAQYVDCVEVNSSFYALPRPDYARRWIELVEPFPDFRFTVKLHGAFTHGALEEISATAAAAFREGVGPLDDADRCLALLAQFPVFFHESKPAWVRLERIRRLFPDSRLVAELRHRSWFTAEAVARLRSLGLGLVHIDLPAARDHPPEDHPSLGPLAYLRLHGRNRRTWFDAQAGRNARYDYRYRRDEVAGVAARLRAIAARAEQAVLVANNHYGGQAVANAIELKSLFAGGPVRAPAPLVDAFPDLRDCVKPEGQMSLW
jgi:uncharacterized protein YecE (DUF72 family)